jgi:hypothetical protein
MLMDVMDEAVEKLKTIVFVVKYLWYLLIHFRLIGNDVH